MIDRNKIMSEILFSLGISLFASSLTLIFEKTFDEAKLVAVAILGIVCIAGGLSSLVGKFEKVSLCLGVSFFIFIALSGWFFYFYKVMAS